MNAVPQWRLAGDWFDICSCDIPCPCEFAQAPTGNHCQGVLAWHVREGQYGDNREALMLEQHARAVLQILPKCLHRLPPVAYLSWFRHSQRNATIGSTFVARRAGT